MSYTSLYRKFRPTKFEEVVGQEHITTTLKNQIIANRTGHAYLLTGARGTGKTSIAKILARAVNCLNIQNGEPCNECENCKAALSGALTDIVEMDAASNNSVEDIRAIRDEVNFLPAVAKYRVYIIDEVHMLSTGAFNALLKTLEEPPEHVKFILATTEPQKLPATILSRCQRFDFKRIPVDDIIKRLKLICKEEKVNITDEALKMIAILAEGALRDAISILERCIQDSKTEAIDGNKIRDLIGIPKFEYIFKTANAIINKDVSLAIDTIHQLMEEGKDLDNFLWEVIKYIKDILVYKVSNHLDLYSDDDIKNIALLAEKTQKEDLLQLIYNLSKLANDMKYSTQKSIVFETGILKECSNGTSQELPRKPINKKQEVPKKTKKEEPEKQKVNKVEVQESQENKTIKEQEEPKSLIDKPKEEIKKIDLPKEITKIQEETGSPKDQTKKPFTCWENVIEKFRKSDEMLLYANLVGTTAVASDSTIEITFPKKVSQFVQDFLNKRENMELLSKYISAESGKTMKIRFIQGKDEGKNIQEGNVISNISQNSDIPF